MQLVTENTDNLTVSMSGLDCKQRRLKVIKL